jgi:hypothetical protein
MINRLITASLVVGLIGISACSTMDAPGGSLHGALAPADNYNDPVKCDSACKPQWERAQLWLTRHSAWKVQMATDVVLQTYSPVSSEPHYGFTVTKEPVGPDGYEISLAMVCGNMLGCDPSPVGVRKAFYYFVATGVDLLRGQNVLSAIR